MTIIIQNIYRERESNDNNKNNSNDKLLIIFRNGYIYIYFFPYILKSIKEIFFTLCL